MAVRSRVKAGGLETTNHNQSGMVVKTRRESGRIQY